MATVGERIRELREERNWSQEYVGSQIGVKGPSVGRYESMERDPDTETLIKLSDLFEVSLDYLTGRSDERITVKVEEEKREDLDDILSELGTIALHRLGDYTKDLPPQAKKQLKEIVIAYLRTYPKE
jgi:transcriptional regulator with XRE-family HTH domain